MSVLTEEQLEFYIDHPVEYIEDTTPFELDEQQKDIVRKIPQAIIEGKGISVKAGHGVGKTFIEANIILWFMATRPFCRILCTATTYNQIMNILWSELKKVHEQSLLKELFEWKKTAFTYKGYDETWFAIARTSNKPEALQGIHAEHVLIIIDEASGVEPEIFEVLEGALTDEGGIMLMFGNPTQTSGGFYDAFNIKREFYYTYTLSCLDSPRVKDGYPKKIAAKYGEDSDVYRVRVLGEFPKQLTDTLIPIAIVEKSFDNTPSTDVNTLEIGCDVARFGSDETSIYYRIGNQIFEYDITHGQDTMKTAGKISALVNDSIDEYENIIINVDDTGVGGGVTDRLREVFDNVNKVVIHGVNNGSRAVDKKRYKNKVTEMWFSFRDWLSEGLIPNDQDLKNQLSVRKYNLTSDGKLMIESKDVMKKRGISSPDRADGAILTINSLIMKDILMSNNKETEHSHSEMLQKIHNFRDKATFKDRMKFYRKGK